MFSSGQFYPGNMSIRFVSEFSRSILKVFVLVKIWYQQLGVIIMLPQNEKEKGIYGLFFPFS